MRTTMACNVPLSRLILERSQETKSNFLRLLPELCHQRLEMAVGGSSWMEWHVDLG